MIPAKFEDIVEATLQGLVANQVSESRSLDFKRELPGQDNSARHEFLSDVCAFANASGGDLVYGIDEDGQGQAQSLAGFAINPDQEIRRLQDVILNGLEAKLTGAQLKAVPLSDGSFAVVVRIPQSWNSPHRVKTNQHFFIREGARKRQLEIPEIRTEFIQSESATEKLRSFRADRIGKILAGESPIPLFEGAVLLMHILPLKSAIGHLEVDPLVYVRGTQPRRMPIIANVHGENVRVNIDGVLSHRNITEHGCGGYTQLYRSGFIEAARVFTSQLEGSGRYNIASQAYEVELIRFFSVLTTELAALQIEPPIVLFLSILHAKKAELGINQAERFGFDAHQGIFDRDTVMLPDILIQEFNDDPVKLLRPMFDLVWNACGFERSLNYDDQGNWRQR